MLITRNHEWLWLLSVSSFDCSWRTRVCPMFTMENAHSFAFSAFSILVPFGLRMNGWTLLFVWIKRKKKPRNNEMWSFSIIFLISVGCAAAKRQTANGRTWLFRSNSNLTQSSTPFILIYCFPLFFCFFPFVSSSPASFKFQLFILQRHFFLVDSIYRDMRKYARNAIAQLRHDYELTSGTFARRSSAIPWWIVKGIRGLF